MSNLTTFKGANLPAVADLSKALKSNLANVADVGTVIIKMDKTGHWVFGSDSTETQDNSEWAINPFSFIHGYIAWGNSEVLGEKMVPINQPLPELEPAPANAKRGWEVQVGLEMTCINGDDKGLTARWATTATGGKRAIQALGVEIAEQIEKDPTKPVAIVSLETEHYTHRSYGKVYTPKISVVRWESMDVESATDAPQLVAEEATDLEETPAPAAPIRRRRAAV
jgi:hypothetical protein